MEEKVYIRLDILDYIKTHKILYEKSFLNFLDSLELNQEDKLKIRNTFLDSINSFNRDIIRMFDNIFKDA